jgi:hypothetical protein
MEDRGGGDPDILWHGKDTGSGTRNGGMSEWRKGKGGVIYLLSVRPETPDSEGQHRPFSE